MTAESIEHWNLLHPLWLLPIPILVLLAVRWHRTRVRDDWSQVMSGPVLHFLLGAHKGALRWNLPLWSGVIACLALAAPASRQTQDDAWHHSTAWIAVVDVSRSMTIDDIVPYRLSAARVALSRLSRESGARPIALVIFAGDAFLVTPPAFDKSYFNDHTALLEYGVVPLDGTNLARALSLTTAIMDEADLVSGRIFVLSDSEGVSDGALAAAQLLGDRGHRLDYLLFAANAEQVQSVGNADVQVNVSDARSLARAGNGVLIQASRLGVIDYDRLELRESSVPSQNSELQTLIWKNQSHWILLVMIPLFLLQFMREKQA